MQNYDDQSITLNCKIPTIQISEVTSNTSSDVTFYAESDGYIRFAWIHHKIESSKVFW